MSLERLTLDSGEVAGVSWEITGISAACGFEIRAQYRDIEKQGFKSHPLLLVSEPARQLLALELVLPAVAKQLGLAAVGGRFAADAIRGLREEGPQVLAARKLADRFIRLTAAVAGGREAEEVVAAAA